MLEINEVKIGNYVTNSKGDIFQITTGAFYLYHQNKEWDVLPIELTEEWLLRFGLTKHNGYPYKFLDGFIKIRNGEYFFKYHNLDIKLNYVHNLQNLHYIFTQTELTLKDEK